MGFKALMNDSHPIGPNNISRKQIRMIGLGHLPVGNYLESNRARYWDGRSENGEQVSSGTYFYQIEVGGYTETRKMVILK